MMDELLEGINENEHLKFIVSLDNNEVNPMLYNCSEWGDLYSELGDFGNDPMTLNGDEDLDSDGISDNHIWNTLAGNTYSAYAFIDHNMVVRHMFDMPNLNDFQNNYIANLLDGIYGCTDENASNYDDSAGIDDGSCEYNTIMGDINGDNEVNILDIISLVNFILTNEYETIGDLNIDGEINILDIVALVNIILAN